MEVTGLFYSGFVLARQFFYFRPIGSLKLIFLYIFQKLNSYIEWMKISYWADGLVI